MYDPTKPYKVKIFAAIEKTWETPYVSVHKALYPLIEKKFQGTEAHHTDGIGTKAQFHWREQTFSAAVRDALAMNLNDLAMVGAIPYSLQNHLTLPEDNHEAILEIINTLSTECRQRDIAMSGGETSIHPGEEQFDISITVCGFVKYPVENKILPGDIILGFASSGLHSNGFSALRQLFGNGYTSPALVVPTRFYNDVVLTLLAKYPIHGLMHITGGAFAKLHDIADTCDIMIDQREAFMPQQIFYELARAGATDQVMYTTFNCGIGFVISAAPHVATQILAERADLRQIGTAAEGSGKITIHSVFSGSNEEV